MTPVAPALDLPTLVDSLRHWARVQPDAVAYLSTVDAQERTLSYSALDRRARAVAAVLRARSAPGSTALLLYPLGLDFIEAFFGCLYAGVVAVPLPLGRGKGAKVRLNAVVRDCAPRVVLTTSELAADLDGLLVSSDASMSPELLETDRIDSAASDDVSRFAPEASSLAFLQYTSGSTSEPKGTMVSHRSIMANQRMLRSVFGTNATTVIGTWLPIFHDMGLIGNVLHTVYLGARAVLLSTLGVVKSPIVWLRAIQRYDIGCSGGPNFAYDLCVSKTTPEEREGLDLSGWRIAFNGSEPVRKHTLETFCATFAPFGFQKRALVPTYGLAEATLVVSGNAGRGPRYFHADARALEENRVVSAPTLDSAQALVSVGRFAHEDQAIAIVNPFTGTPCQKEQIGEVWIRGAHVASGYWQNAAATERTFGARLPGDDRSYLRTGDLGFVSDSELFVTGRIKDLIIFRGRKLYPQDVELSVELGSSKLRPGCTAAFSAGSDGAAGIVIVAEIGRREDASPELLARLAMLVQEEHELPVSRFVLVARNSVPKTTSGKIQRQECKAALLRGDYAIVAEWRGTAAAPPDSRGEDLVAHAADWIARTRRVPLESIDPDTPIAALGIDSIRKVELVVSLEQRFGISIADSSFFAIETLRDLGKLAAGPSQTKAPAKKAPADAAPSTLPARAVLPAFSAMNWKVPRG
jgi:acyl-CoA synthetase (AMP-forming)/AMP-acid ligase II/acyl carrier protein